MMRYLAFISFIAGPLIAAEAEQDVFDTWEISSKARTILARLDSAGEKFKSLKANIVYRVYSPLTGDIEERSGWMAYRKIEGDDGRSTAKFRACFRTLRLGEGREMINQIDYMFDGRWLIVAKHKIKSLTKIEVAAEGEMIESMKMGSEPLPIPFGRSVVEIVPRFKAFTERLEEDGPEDADYIRLIPRKKHRDKVNFIEMQMWIDRKTGIPLKLISIDRHKKVTTAIFSNIDTESKLEDNIFTMKKPAGWDVTMRRKQKGKLNKSGT